MNVHSQGRVALYKPGERPADNQDAATSSGLTDDDDEDIELATSSEHETAAKSQQQSYL